MINAQKEGEATIYIYGIREALEEGVGMGDVKRLKHYPNIKQLYFQTSTICYHTHVLIILIQIFQGLTCAPKNILLIPINSQHGLKESIVILMPEARS